MKMKLLQQGVVKPATCRKFVSRSRLEPKKDGGFRLVVDLRRVWLFDLDNTLHDASAAVFPHLRDSMTRYIQEALGVAAEEAHLLRVRYWQRYGATLLGLVRHHGVQPAHFLHHTHLLPGLEQRVRGHRADIAALKTTHTAEVKKITDAAATEVATVDEKIVR